MTPRKIISVMWRNITACLSPRTTVMQKAHLYSWCEAAAYNPGAAALVRRVL